MKDYLWNVFPLMFYFLSPKQLRPPLKSYRFKILSQFSVMLLKSTTAGRSNSFQNKVIAGRLINLDGFE